MQLLDDTGRALVDREWNLAVSEPCEVARQRGVGLPRGVVAQVESRSRGDSAAGRQRGARCRRGLRRLEPQGQDYETGACRGTGVYRRTHGAGRNRDDHFSRRDEGNSTGRSGNRQREGRSVRIRMRAKAASQGEVASRLDRGSQMSGGSRLGRCYRG